MQGSAEYQPLTPFIEAIRGLALGTPREWNVQLAIIWGVSITIAGCASAMTIHERKSVR